MKLIHAADIHLGRRRLDGRLPDTDFSHAFGAIAEAAIQERADAVLLAGDLFDHPQVQPPHLRQAQTVLQRLKDAKIPVLAIEGNHDKGPVHAAVPTWLEFLAEDDLLRLLTTRFNADGALLSPWNPTTRSGSWLDMDGIRFVGTGYLGAATPHKLRQVVQALDPDRCHVLLLHAGPDYFVGEGGGFSGADLDALRERVTYLALGHIHKPMIHKGWACNPGSPENTDLTEARYDRDPSGSPRSRGYALVEIDPHQRQAPTRLEIRSTRKRPVVEVEIDCTPFGNKLKHGEETLIASAASAITRTSAPGTAVVIVHLVGSLNLHRIPIDRDRVTAEIERLSGVTAVSLDFAGLNLDGALPASSADGAMPPRDVLEKLAIRALVDTDPFWAADENPAGIAELFFDLKESVRLGRSPDELAERIANDPLVQRVQSRPPPSADSTTSSAHATGGSSEPASPTQPSPAPPTERPTAP